MEVFKNLYSILFVRILTVRSIIVVFFNCVFVNVRYCYKFL